MGGGATVWSPKHGKKQPRINNPQELSHKQKGGVGKYIFFFVLSMCPKGPEKKSVVCFPEKGSHTYKSVAAGKSDHYACKHRQRYARFNRGTLLTEGGGDGRSNILVWGVSGRWKLKKNNPLPL